jgi:hypothetical protein
VLEGMKLEPVITGISKSISASTAMEISSAVDITHVKALPSET